MPPEIDEELAKRANEKRFEIGMKLATFRAITEQLVKKQLVTKEEERKIMARIKEIERVQIEPGQKHRR